MDWFVKRFIKASLTWLGLGVTAGLTMAIHPAWIVYRPAHFHMNLAGFVAMMIFGVSYHVMPRIVGQPLYSSRLAGIHWWAANLGLAFMVSGFLLAPHLSRAATASLVTGGVLYAGGAYVFILNLWRTIDGHWTPAPAAASPTAETSAPRRRSLPVAEG
jgi:cbb3-type cytochrome oxidase subunit 1